MNFMGRKIRTGMVAYSTSGSKGKKERRTRRNSDHENAEPYITESSPYHPSSINPSYTAPIAPIPNAIPIVPSAPRERLQTEHAVSSSPHNPSSSLVPPSGHASSTTTPRWTCDGCGLPNLDQCMICAACNAARPDEEIVVPPIDANASRGADELSTSAGGVGGVDRSRAPVDNSWLQRIDFDSCA